MEAARMRAVLVLVEVGAPVAVGIAARAVGSGAHESVQAEQGLPRGEQAVCVHVDVADEHVVLLVRVPRDDVGEGRVERHEASGRTQRGIEAVAARRGGAVEAHVQACRHPCLQVTDVHMRVALQLLAAEVHGIRVEAHEHAVCTDVGHAAEGADGAWLRLDVSRAQVDARGHARLAVVEEDIVLGVPVGRHERAGTRPEDDQAPAAVDRRVVALAVALGAGARDAHPLGLVVHAVVHEHVLAPHLYPQRRDRRHRTKMPRSARHC